MTELEILEGALRLLTPLVTAAQQIQNESPTARRVRLSHQSINALALLRGRVYLLRKQNKTETEVGS